MTEEEAWEDLENRLSAKNQHTEPLRVKTDQQFSISPEHNANAPKIAESAIQSIEYMINRIATLEALVMAHKEIFISDGYIEAWEQAEEVLSGCKPHINT